MNSRKSVAERIDVDLVEERAEFLVLPSLRGSPHANETSQGSDPFLSCVMRSSTPADRPPLE